MGNHICPWWVGYLLISPLRRLRENPRKILSPYVKEGMTVMDLGCGMGFFTLEMARLVGPEGSVIAVDLQERMLKTLRRRAERGGLTDRIHTHRCEPNNLGVHPPADFVLACYIAHEVPDKRSFFLQIRSLLKVGGKLLLAEPKFHVTRKEFDEIVADAMAAGLVHQGEAAARIGRNAVFEKR